MNISPIQAFKDLPDRLIATVHKDPDVDAIGSLLALGELMDGLGKPITLYAPDLQPTMFRYLPGIDRITPTALPEYDLAFFLDCSDRSRIAKPDAFPSVMSIFNIDHHQDNTMFGDINLVQNISSVGEMMHGLFTALDVPITQTAATLIYSAICFDTGNFKFANTTAQTFQVASDLLNRGIASSKISEYIFEQKSRRYFEDIRIGLSNMYIDKKYPFIIVHIPNHDQMSNESTINFFRELENIELVIVCKEVKKHQHRLSFRSKQQVNAAQIARAFNGGGHIRAAGATIQIPYQTLKTSLIQKAVEAFS